MKEQEVWLYFGRTGRGSMEIRKAEAGDYEEIMRIYAYARKFMAEHGNPGQWGNGHPAGETIKKDIENQKCHVCVGEEGRLLGVFYFAEEEDPTYQEIDGAWKNEKPYGVVHRIASAPETKGVGSFCLKWALQQCGNLRIDTHDDNVPMQSLLKKLGFSYCGRIRLKDGSPRIAFQKILVENESLN